MILGLKLERTDSRPGRADLRPKRIDGGGGKTNGQMNKSRPVFFGTSSPLGPLPKKGAIAVLKIVKLI